MGSDQSGSRSELWELMRIARVGRQGAIYDAPAAAQAFSEGELFDVSGKNENISENAEKKVRPKRKMILITCRAFLSL